jgi:His/Glu/Gln/Arg/opine family amino acid ABC transporter permease subunit
MRVALPGLGNIWTALVKDTSLISTLAVSDLLRAASEASRATTRPILFYSAAAATYLVFNIVSARAGLPRTARQPRLCLMLEQLAGTFDIDLLGTHLWRLLHGLCITAEVVLISCGLGFVLAYPLARARMSRNRLIAAPARAYVTFFQGTPLLCQLYLVYYGGGEIRPFLTSAGTWWFFRDAFSCCIFAFTLNTAAYQAEIMRGALRPYRKARSKQPAPSAYHHSPSHVMSYGRRRCWWHCARSATN